MDPTEEVQEHLQHAATHGEHPSAHAAPSSRWITAAALTAAILAAFAAISGALSNSHLTESTHRRIDANDQWSLYQSKSIKSAIIDSRLYTASVANLPPPKSDLAKKAEYEAQLPEIQTTAKALVVISDQHVRIHDGYETAETMFHISIAIVAIAVVAKRRSFWYVSMLMGIAGLFFFAKAHQLPVNPDPETPTQSATAPAATVETH